MKQKETITTNTSTLGEVYNEAFDVKLLRTRSVLSPRCPKCFRWGHHHRPQCEYATRGDALHHMDEALKREKHARERAAEWMSACRQMHGKIAMLKHENNQLRKKVAPQPARNRQPQPSSVARDHWNALDFDYKEEFLFSRGYKKSFAAAEWDNLGGHIQYVWTNHIKDQHNIELK